MTKVTTYALILIIVSLFFAGTYSILGTLTSSENYNVANVDISVADRYQGFSNLDGIDETRADLENIQSDKESQFFVGQWDGVKNSISLLGSSFVQIFNATQSMADEKTGIGLPTDVGNAMLIILVILIIGTIITILVKVKS